MKNLFFIGIITLAFVGCKSDQMLSFRVCNEETKKRYLKVDFDEINSGKVADSQYVCIKGVFHYYFEDISLYPTSKENSKAIWINFLKIDLAEDSILKRISGREVMVYGKLDLLSKGHLGYYMGTLNNVECISIYE